MFTGLVEAMGEVRAVAADGHGGSRLDIATPFTQDLTSGESIAVNGCCLTVVATNGAEASFQAGPETLTRTNLGGLAAGTAVNLERALRLEDRLGGHLVTGHIDGVGRVTMRRRQGEWEFFAFAAPRELMPLLVAKGSIAVDGISLTVVDVADDGFSVMLIPHTLEVTTLGRARVGTAVNLETDLIAKHVARWLTAYQPKS